MLLYQTLDLGFQPFDGHVLDPLGLLLDPLLAPLLLGGRSSLLPLPELGFVPVAQLVEACRELGLGTLELGHQLLAALAKGLFVMNQPVDETEVAVDRSVGLGELLLSRQPWGGKPTAAALRRGCRPVGGGSRSFGDLLILLHLLLKRSNGSLLLLELELLLNQHPRHRRSRFGVARVDCHGTPRGLHHVARSQHLAAARHAEPTELSLNL
mmetsp:Transcript_33985/g.102498  ORF Transcript_33985/g.102498 Transcript_33985/m.102498 type:complete len:211 (+) Transcript_33985:3525-4157(+)